MSSFTARVGVAVLALLFVAYASLGVNAVPSKMLHRLRQDVAESQPQRTFAVVLLEMEGECQLQLPKQQTEDEKRCPSGKNCCFNKQGCLSLCPHKGGVCCPHSDHCCPANHHCVMKGSDVHCKKAAQPKAESAAESGAEGGAEGGAESGAEGAAESGAESGAAEGAAESGAEGAAESGAEGAAESGAEGSDEGGSDEGGSDEGGSDEGGSSEGSSDDDADDKPQKINIISHVIVDTHPKKATATF